MLDAILGFFSGYLVEKMMQKNIKPYQISLFLVVFAVLLIFAHEVFILNQAIDVDSALLALGVFGPIFVVLWALISYFYRKEKREKAQREQSKSTFER